MLRNVNPSDSLINITITIFSHCFIKSFATYGCWYPCLFPVPDARKRQWQLNKMLSQMMIHNSIPSIDHNKWLYLLDTQLNEPTV